MFATSPATSKPRSPLAYVAGMEVDKPMHSIESPTTTQPTEALPAEGELTSLLGDPPTLVEHRAAAPHTCRAHGSRRPGDCFGAQEPSATTGASVPDLSASSAISQCLRYTVGM